MLSLECVVAHLALPVNLGGALLGPRSGAVDDGVDAHQRRRQRRRVTQVSLPSHIVIKTIHRVRGGEPPQRRKMLSCYWLDVLSTTVCR